MGNLVDRCSYWCILSGLAAIACGGATSGAEPGGSSGGAGGVGGSGGSSGSGGSGGNDRGGAPCRHRRSNFEPPAAAEVRVQDRRPLPISGGHLLVSHDGAHAAVADPDRDRVYLVLIDEEGGLQRHAEVELDAGDEPGRLAEDDHGAVHVALRGSGDLVSIALDTGTITSRRHICDHPRGMSYDAERDLLRIACMSGELVSVAPQGQAEPDVVEVADDLRDVVVRGDELLVTTFRRSQLLRLNAEGALLERSELRAVHSQSPQSSCGFPELGERDFAARVAWRLVPYRDREALLLHQRAQASPLDLAGPSYASVSSCFGIAHSTISLVGANAALAALPATLAVDLAVSETGYLAVAAPGNPDASLMVFNLEDYLDDSADPENIDPQFCAEPWFTAEQKSVVSVAFTPGGKLLAMGREPTALSMFALEPEPQQLAALNLGPEGVHDTGHFIFHADVGTGITCASCHPEGGDDGHVWDFEGIGPRRTMPLWGGLLGTEPFHWDGNAPDFEAIVAEVLEHRMGGPHLVDDAIAALASWLDALPAPRRTGLDSEQVQFGRTLFEADNLGCVTCHAGERLTNNETLDIGTGLSVQVPSLRGVSFHAPFMHDGCAPGLIQSLGTCGRGDEHGQHIDGLAPIEVNALVQYLESL